MKTFAVADGPWSELAPLLAKAIGFEQDGIAITTLYFAKEGACRVAIGIRVDGSLLFRSMTIQQAEQLAEVLKQAANILREAQKRAPS